MAIDNLHPPDPDNLPVDAATPAALPAEHEAPDEGDRVTAPAEYDAGPLPAGTDADQEIPEVNR
jgi:hypothetical protein